MPVYQRIQNGGCHTQVVQVSSNAKSRHLEIRQKLSIQLCWYDVMQARSQTYVSGVAILFHRSHVVRSLRAYFMLYVVKIKWIMCVQKKLNVLVCHRDQGLAKSKFQEISALL